MQGSEFPKNDLIRVGILKVGDLINENNVLLHEIADVQLSPEQRFIYYGHCALENLK